MSSSTFNPRETPAYSLLQAAHYVGVPYATLRRWASPTGVIVAPVAGLLSFNNLLEAHVLKSMRRTHGLSLQSIRRALQELSSIQNLVHPLLHQSFETDGISLCIRLDEQVINLSKSKQAEFIQFVRLYLHRIERNAQGIATRLFPFITSDSAQEPRTISISPTVAFGRPVLVGTGISTSVIAGRFASRDTLSSLAAEYRIDEKVLEDAIRWEMLKGKAA